VRPPKPVQVERHRWPEVAGVDGHTIEESELDRPAVGPGVGVARALEAQQGDSA
jgi:hypothetical protein